MAREMSRLALIERSINKRFREELWQPFVLAVRKYQLVPEGCRIAAAVSGGKSSLLTAKLLQELARHSDVPFSLRFFTLDAGFSAEERAALAGLLETLGIPAEVIPAERADLPALAEAAAALGCDRLAVGDRREDVVETVMENMLYRGTLAAVLPMERCGPVTVIRPLYCILDADAAQWVRYNQLTPLPGDAPEACTPAREAVRALLREQQAINPLAENGIFRAIHNVWKDTFPGEGHRP